MDAKFNFDCKIDVSLQRDQAIVLYCARAPAGAFQ
jgi:hypothetical protein